MGFFDKAFNPLILFPNTPFNLSLLRPFTLMLLNVAPGKRRFSPVPLLAVFIIVESSLKDLTVALAFRSYDCRFRFNFYYFRPFCALMLLSRSFEIHSWN